MFFAAIFILYRDLENTRLIDVVGSLEALPKTRVIVALALTAASYLLLTAYDFLALNYVGHKLQWWETLFASFIAFSFSNNLGFALMSGGSVRYWIYTGFRPRPRRNLGNRRVLHPHLWARCHVGRRADVFCSIPRA